MKRFKHLTVIAISGVCVLGLIGFNYLTPSSVEAAAKGKEPAKQSASTKKKEPVPVVAVATPVVKLASKVGLTFFGSGFEPEKEIIILLKDEEGQQSDITPTPASKTDKAGAFIAQWQAGDFIKAKLIKEGVYTVVIADAKFNPLALTPISFIADKAKDEKAKDEKPKDDKAKGEKKAKDDKEKK